MFIQIIALNFGVWLDPRELLRTDTFLRFARREGRLMRWETEEPTPEPEPTPDDEGDEPTE